MSRIGEGLVQGGSGCPPANFAAARRRPRQRRSCQRGASAVRNAATFAFALVLQIASGRAGAAEAVIAIDPGHGGTNLGAAGVVPGLFEKRVTLSIAQRLRSELAASGTIAAILCRETDLLVPIRARVRCAERAGAQLFLSLHANASPLGAAHGRQSGFEIYLLPAAIVESEVEMAALAAPSDVDAAWSGHALRRAAAESGRAARVVRAHLKKLRGERLDRGIRQTGATLDVLRGAAVPALLVELGFIDHAEEGRYLASSVGQEAFARALAAAVMEFLLGESEPVARAADQRLAGRRAARGRGSHRR